jgi:hypothetical protein
MPKKTIKKVTSKKVAAKTVKKNKVPATSGSNKGTTKHVCRVTKNDPVRDNRIDMEIVVDAYDSYERAMGWFCSLEDTIDNNVRCRCRKTRSMSPLNVDEEVDVLGVAPVEDCENEMFVFVQWNAKKLAVPLEQLEPIVGDPKAIEIVEDWLYWCLMEYEF